MMVHERRAGGAVQYAPPASEEVLRAIRGLHVAQLIESDGPGGAERVLADLSLALQAAGCHVLVILPVDGEGWLARQLAGSGVVVEYYRLERRLSRAFARWLGDTFRRHRIAIAHSHEFAMAVYGAWAAWRAGVRHIITMHGGRYYAQRLRRRLALRVAFAMSGRVVAVSQALARRLGRDLWVRRSRIATIPNGVRHVRGSGSSVREALELSPEDRLVLAVGNLYPVKGHSFLVEALGLTAQSQPRAHVAIAGRGQLADALNRRAQELGLSDRVHLLGLRSDIPDLLAAADVFVLPSVSEGLPLVLLEAMFAGLPIIASDVGDVRLALADGEAGLLVHPGSPEALAEALDCVLRNPGEASALGKRAASRAAAEYGISRMVASYAAAYGDLVAHR